MLPVRPRETPSVVTDKCTSPVNELPVRNNLSNNIKKVVNTTDEAAKPRPEIPLSSTENHKRDAQSAELNVDLPGKSESEAKKPVSIHAENNSQEPEPEVFARVVINEKLFIPSNTGAGSDKIASGTSNLTHPNEGIGRFSVDFQTSAAALSLYTNPQLQELVTEFMHSHHTRPLRANFSNIYGMGNNLFDDFSALSEDLNPDRLEGNCCFCTSAALTNQSVKEMVEITEIMQQDGASFYEIADLFKSMEIQPVITNASANKSCTTEQLWQQVYDYLIMELGEKEALGLIWIRTESENREQGFPLESGHSVVIAKDPEGRLVKLDYQTGKIAELNKTSPPGGSFQQSYHFFQREGTHAHTTWQSVWDSVVSQFTRGRSDKGVYGVLKNGEMKFFFYRILDEKRMWAHINGKGVRLNRDFWSPPDDSDNPVIWCLWPGEK
ncbi:hypothetical protein [Erwinia mallotivora]|uniref:hypothetical protein n=1 Tax=Erwinia mallotivora TaxID=69222 RepID=UPI0021C22EE7|nr:hypothetical protein [Erwinia mallotivora]